MAIFKQKLFKADEMQPDGTIYDEDSLIFIATTDSRFRYEPDDRTLYAFVETNEN